MKATPPPAPRIRYESATRLTAITEEVYKRYHAHGGCEPWHALGVAKQVAWEAAVGALLSGVQAQWHAAVTTAIDRNENVPLDEAALLARLKNLPVTG